MKLNVFGKFCLLSYAFVMCATVPVALNEEDEGELLKKAHEMLSYMNESVDPCENFYEFACGNWANVHPANTSTVMETSYMLLINDAFDKKAIAILQETNNPSDTDIDKKVKNFYQSCTSLKNGIPTEKIVEVISEFGTMPALIGSGWDEEHFDWLETLAKVKHQYGSQIIIGIEIIADVHDKSKNRVYIGESSFPLESKSIYLEPVGERYRMMYKMSVASKLRNLLGMDPDIAKTTAGEIVEFEISLAKGMSESKSNESLSSLLLNTTAEEMQRKYTPTIDIKKFLNITLGEIPNGLIYEYVPDYLVNLKDVIEKTEKRIIANYIFYHLIKMFSLDTSTNEEKLAEICLETVKEQFVKNIQNMVYRSFDSKAVEKDLLRIWNELKSLLRSKLESNTSLNWMTYETRQAAKEKLQEVILKINSYADWDFKKDFESLETTEDDYVANLKNIMVLDTKRYMARLNSPLTSVNVGSMASVTPTNNLIENAVRIPVAFLQPYFVWAPNFPDALKFGITGYLLAHELIHTFDETGRQFGKYGNLEDWWDETSTEGFEERRECFKDQYQRYIYGGKSLPRSEAQSENIADNSGLKLAYEAYINTRKRELENTDKMPSMDYSSQKLFFIGFGQIMCGDLLSFLRNLQTEIDTHTPGKFRAIGAVSNLVEFSEAFECKAENKMNPSTKCEMF